jgi:hypothetical protein
MFFQILGTIAAFEHALMIERTLDGLSAARALGRTGGQKAQLTLVITASKQTSYESREYQSQLALSTSDFGGPAGHGRAASAGGSRWCAAGGSRLCCPQWGQRHIATGPTCR